MYSQVFLINSTRVNVTDIALNNVSTGIFTFESSFLRFTNVTILDTNNIGVWLRNSSFITVENISVINSYWIGLLLFNSSYCSLKNVVSRSNGLGIAFINGSSNNNIEGSLVINSSADGLELIDSCNNNTIQFINVTNNSGPGIKLDFSSNFNNISFSNITFNSGEGILIDNGCTSNRIFNNSICNNTNSGIRIKNSNSEYLYSNEFINNDGVGIELDFNTNDTMTYWNSFVDNNGTGSDGGQAIDDGHDNIWDDNKGRGNYWSDYTIRYPTANQLDDCWSIPYEINGSASSVDRYPLVGSLPRIVNKARDILCAVNSDIEIYWILEDDINGSHYAIYENSTHVVPWTAWENGTWNVTFSTRMDQGGIYNYTLRFNNSRGVFGKDSSVLVVCDNTFPYIQDFDDSLIIINSGGYNNTGSSNLTFTLLDDYQGGSCTVYLDDNLMASYSNWSINDTISIDLKNTSDGFHSINISLSDAAGNQLMFYRTLLKDTVAPNITAFYPGQVQLGETSNILVSIIDNIALVNGRYNITFDGTVLVQGVFTNQTTQDLLIEIQFNESGSHLISINASDLAGNMEMIKFNITATQISDNQNANKKLVISVITIAGICGSGGVIVAVIYLKKFKKRERGRSQKSET
ncbi:MAG: NosD domain-containing protein [Promethearchaeota archaeon]